MRTSHEADTADAEPLLDISSLIDVCFLLLIYFLVTSTITPRERDLDMRLPGDRTGPDEAIVDPLRLRIDAFGGVHAHEEPCDSDTGLRDLPGLSRRLSLYADTCRASNVVPMVSLDVADESGHQRLIDVLNTLALHHIRVVTFRDAPPAP